MFLTKRQIIMRRLKSVVAILILIALYAAMVGVAILLINNF